MNPTAADAASEKFTTFRIYATEGEQLAKLASLRGRTIAETYRELCADAVRAALREEMQKQAHELGGEG